MRPAGFDQTSGVDNIIDYAFGHARGHVNRAAMGINSAIIDDSRAQIFAVIVFGFGSGLFIDRKTEEVIAVEIHGEFFACAQRDSAKISGDDAVIFYARRKQRDHAALFGGDKAFINDAGIAFSGMVEFIIPGIKIFVGNIGAAGNQSRHVHLRIGAEEDAAAIDDHYLAVGIQFT